MKVISIINLKGGVGKTISSINIAHVLATVHNKRVLLIDNDKQGNTSKFFNKHDKEGITISDLFMEKVKFISDIIMQTKHSRLDLVTANMRLLAANSYMIMNSTHKIQQFKLKTALKNIEDEYDYCIIDNPPDSNLNVTNALVASNDVIIPIKIDKFSEDGMEELIELLNNAKQMNEGLTLRGCFVTMFDRSEVNKAGEITLKSKYKMFKTHIRKTTKVDESTYVGKALLEWSRRCGAANDYIDLVKEIMEE